MDSIESGSKEYQEHFNFETHKIGEELQTSHTPRINAVEVSETGTEAENELYTISRLIKK